MIDPASCGNMFVELPLKFGIFDPAEEFLADNIKPKQLLAQRVPERTFAKNAVARVENCSGHLYTSS